MTKHTFGRNLIRWGAAVALASTMLSPGAASAETVLRVAMTLGDIPAWTGQPDQGYEGYRFVGFNLHDGLINWDLSKSDREPALRPGLATKWEVDPANHKRWIITLREGVKFHDGSDLTPEVVAWNFARLTDKTTQGFDPAQFARMRTRASNIDHVEPLGANQVALFTKAPDSFTPFSLTNFLMISKKALEKANWDYAAYAKAPAGTGPYKFDKVVPHERLELVRNENYWDKDRIPKHDRLVLVPMPEATTRTAALLSGQVDFIEAPSPDTIPRLQSAGMTIVTNTYPHNWTYQVNMIDPPFNDIKVRQAANYAVNREDVAALLNGTGEPGYAMLPPSSRYFGHPVKYDFDPEKATALLKEAKCFPCEINVAMSTAGSGQMQPLAMNELVKSQLEAVGFKVNFNVMDWSALHDISLKGREAFPDIDAINVSRAPMEPYNGILGFVMKNRFAPNGPNWGWFSTDEIDALGAKAMETFDEPQRDAMVTKIHELTVAQAPMVYIAHDLNPRAMSPKVKGFVQAQSWFQDLTPIVVEP
ncbi:MULTISPECIES: ABC transporter substrate-binding protein [Hyphomicrobiales]|uniref:ABC transporter substrate-binding protein n=1 Tax=Hyphomicrobiales TaxID=356 RepID=UPI000379452F|nr:MULTISPECIES: ABC transporter substrate-binding protein [Phyllobacteriaceae]MCX8570562.1 ABC transporter substrate-binding protein [Aminobacter sp. MET-1]